MDMMKKKAGAYKKHKSVSEEDDGFASILLLHTITLTTIHITLPWNCFLSQSLSPS
jgi:hypothetical protein